MTHDTAFQMAASNIRFGQGVTREIGMDLANLGVERTMVLIDPRLVASPVGETVIGSLRDVPNRRFGWRSGREDRVVHFV